MSEQNAEQKVWFVTGAGRGLGTSIAQAALAAGHAVVATGRNPDQVTRAVGENERLLAVRLDVTDPAEAETAVAGALDRSAESMCWSTTQATSTPDSSRR
ncbi:SDR family NAD(P)-dependent oxidoreductase [Arthrobacter sp. zg-Y826]|nr:SDR family NAD(P)-dependent oxidoreductase [Arthrobacter jinronghuae]